MVKSKVAITALVFMCAMFVIGLVLIFRAPTAGQNAGYREIMRHGGSMDTQQYERVISANTTAFTVGGLVLSLVGGMGVLASGVVALRG